MNKGKKMSISASIIHALNFEPPPTLEVGDVPNAPDWHDYMSNVEEEIRPKANTGTNLASAFADATAMTAFFTRKFVISWVFYSISTIN